MPEIEQAICIHALAAETMVDVSKRRMIALQQSHHEPLHIKADIYARYRVSSITSRLKYLSLINDFVVLCSALQSFKISTNATKMPCSKVKYAMDED